MESKFFIGLVSDIHFVQYFKFYKNKEEGEVIVDLLHT